MAKLLILLTRIAWKVFRLDRKAYFRLLAAHYPGDLLSLAHESRGISLWQPNDAGEQFLMARVLQNIFESQICVVDIGANEGFYSELVHTAFPKATLYAFEPNPTAVEILKKNAGSYAHIFNVAVGSSNGTVKLYNSASLETTRHGSIYPESLEEFRGYSEVDYHEVPAITLSDFLLETPVERVDLLKIDVEGHEMQVLQGCKNELAKGVIRIIQFEFNDMNIISRVFLRDFFELLSNFDFYRLKPRSIQKLLYSPKEEIFQIQNILAVLKDDSLAEYFRTIAEDPA